ncbi:MAG: twin-arginine translocation signal domain-containing protein, partial [Burkholderia ambifaria]
MTIEQPSAASHAPAAALSRRSFLQAAAAAGGGLMLSLNLPTASAAAGDADTFA